MYSPEWAKSRFDLLYQSHARASYFLLTHLEITPKTVWMWLAKSNVSSQNRDYWELWKALLSRMEALCPALRPGSTIQMYSKLARSTLHDIFMEVEENLPPRVWTAAVHWRENEKRLLKEGGTPSRPGSDRPKADDGQLLL